jgi:hypothetical protein
VSFAYIDNEKYVVNYYHEIIVYDRNWNYMKKEAFLSPLSLLAINKTLVITGGSNIWKTDSYLKVIKEYNDIESQFCGIWYNETNNLLYIPNILKNRIDLFNQDFSKVGEIKTSLFKPFSITESKNKLYVGTREGVLLEIVDKEIVQNITICKTLDKTIDGEKQTLSSILFDYLGNMAVSCPIDSKIYLYYSNMTYSGLNMTTDYPYYSNFDSEGHFVVINQRKISIYNYTIEECQDCI